MANPSADFPSAIHTPIDISLNSNTALGATTPTHTQVEGKQEAEVVAVQTKVGVGNSPASTASTGDVLTKQGDGTTAWAAQSAASSDDTKRYTFFIGG